MIRIKIQDLVIDVAKDFKMSEEEFLNLTNDQKLVLLDEHLDSIKIRSSSIATAHPNSGKQTAGSK